MDENKFVQNSNEKVNVESENVFTKKARTINPVVYFFISLLNALLGVVKWVADLFLSMVLSLAHFFKMVGVGAVKGVIGIGNFFKRKAHQFKHNDKNGKLSFFLFGASALAHKQKVIGIMYIVFEVAYIALFAIFGVSSIAGLKTLGTKMPGPDPDCDDMFCEWIDGDNSIMILIYGLLWVLSIFIFFYVWNRSIENGYLNYRIDNYLKFEEIDKKNVEFSKKLDAEAKVAFANGVSLKEFKASKQEEVEAYLASIENEQEADYTRYLIDGTFAHSYKHLKEMAKQEAVLAKLVAKKDALAESRQENRVEKVALRDQKLAAYQGNDEDEIDKINSIVEIYDNNTMLKVSNADKKIKKQQYVMQELTKRYSSYVEMQHTKNNDKYGKFNDYYKHVASLDTQLLFYRNFDQFKETYETNLSKNQERNEFNAQEAVRLFEEMNSKIAVTKEKFAKIRERRAALNAEVEQIKVDYQNEVKEIKASNAANKEELLLEAKSKLIDLTTVTMRKLNDLPSEKNVNALEKEEIRESKASYARDKKYLKTNYTAEEFALEETVNVMLVEYKLDYKVAVALANSMFVTENKEKRFLTSAEVNEQITRLTTAKEEYNELYPNKYAGKSKSFKETISGLMDENFHITILSLPVIGIVLFSIVPLLFSILIAFTNYSTGHVPPTQLFTWNGLENFKNIFFPDPDSVFVILPKALGKTVSWTLIWALIATFSNYILGIVVALMINKDGIRFKGLWRTIFMMTIAVPQFISLLSIGTLLKDSGAIGTWFFETFGKRMGFGTDGSEQGVLIAKIVIIVINIWVGIPYTILSTTGILLNIPKDLYESSRVDGAGTFTQFTKITMPYILFVTGPSLITNFIGNINNFNVIFFLTGGGPSYGGSALLGLGQTDLLITFLYKIVTSTNNPQYGIASALGIVIFIICSFISIVMFNKSGSIKEEDQFQ